MQGASIEWRLHVNVVAAYNSKKPPLSMAASHHTCFCRLYSLHSELEDLMCHMVHDSTWMAFMQLQCAECSKVNSERSLLFAADGFAHFVAFKQPAK